MYICSKHLWVPKKKKGGLILKKEEATYWENSFFLDRWGIDFQQGLYNPNTSYDKACMPWHVHRSTPWRSSGGAWNRSQPRSSAGPLHRWGRKWRKSKSDTSCHRLQCEKSQRFDPCLIFFQWAVTTSIWLIDFQPYFPIDQQSLAFQSIPLRQSPYHFISCNFWHALGITLL